MQNSSQRSRKNLKITNLNGTIGKRDERTILRSESMDDVELRKELNSIYDEISDANFDDKYQIKEALFKLVRFSEILIAEIEKTTTQAIDVRNTRAKDSERE